MAMKRDLFWALYGDHTAAYTWDHDVGEHHWLNAGLPQSSIPVFKLLPTRLHESIYDPEAPRYFAPLEDGARLWL